MCCNVIIVLNLLQYIIQPSKRHIRIIHVYPTSIQLGELLRMQMTMEVDILLTNMNREVGKDHMMNRHHIRYPIEARS